MSKVIHFLLGICVIPVMFLGCQQADKLMFHEMDALTMRIPKYDTTCIFRQDTVTYTFAFESTDVTEKIIKIPMELVGFAQPYDRTYYIALTLGEGVVNGVNFEKLTEEQVLHADKGIDTLEIILYRTEDIQTQTKWFKIELVEGGDFHLGIQDETSMIIRFSDVLEEPDWWVNWERYFGPFHRIKYQEWIRIWGGTGDLSNSKYWGGVSTAPQEIMAIKELQKYFEENPHYTEEGELITIPCPL